MNYNARSVLVAVMGGLVSFGISHWMHLLGPSYQTGFVVGMVTALVLVGAALLLRKYGRES